MAAQSTTAVVAHVVRERRAVVALVVREGELRRIGCQQ